MGEDKLNSDNESRQNKKTVKQNVKNQNERLIIDDMTQKDKNNEDSSMKQPLSDATDSTSTTDTSDTSDTCNNFDIKSLADKVVNINILRFELDRLPLDFKAKAYFENDVRPLIDTLYNLSIASTGYSTAAKDMASTNFGRSSKIKDALDLVEEVNEISEDLIKVLRCKIDNMLKLSKYDCK